MAAPGLIRALPAYQPGALTLSGDERIEIVSTGQASGTSGQLLLTDAVGKTPSVMQAALPATGDLIAFFQLTSGLGRVTQLSSFTVAAGNVPTGGSTGQLLYKLSGVDYSATFTGVAKFLQSQSGLFTSGSATALLLGIATAGVGRTQLATAAVGAAQLQAGAVGSSQLATGAVGATQLQAGAVGSTQLATSAVVAANIATGAVSSTQLAAGAVSSAQLVPFAVGSSQLATGAVSSAQLAPFAVGSSKIATGGVAFANLPPVQPGALLGGWGSTTASATTAPVLGTTAATGSLGLAGFSAGVVTLRPGAGTFGSWSFYLPTSAAATTTPSQALIGGSPCSWTTVLTSAAAGWGLASQPAGLAAATALPAAGLDAIVNLAMTVAVANSSLSISFLNNSGNNASAGSPILVPFQATNATAAVPQWAAITGPLSLTTSMTATLGAANASVPFRYWVVLFWQNATNCLPALINCSNATQIFPLNNQQMATSALMSATATSCGVFYSNGTVATALAPFKIAGFLEYSGGLSTAGIYTAAPTTLRLFGPGIPKPGEIIQSLFTSSLLSGTVATATFTFAGFSAIFTPASSCNPLAIIQAAQIGNAIGPWTAVVGLARASSSVPGAALLVTYGGNVNPAAYAYSLNVFDFPATASPVTYSVIAQSNNAAVSWNKQTAGTSAATLQIQELMG